MHSPHDFSPGPSASREISKVPRGDRVVNPHFFRHDLWGCIALFTQELKNPEMRVAGNDTTEPFYITCHSVYAIFSP
jgi:hypothetical protein